LIPRALPLLYEIRNNRGVGHVGGDVDPNFMDANAVVNMSSWILAELIRIFHNVTIAVAQETVDSLVERRHPLVWELDGMRRVLDPGMNAREQVLILLHTRASWSNTSDLFSWVEYGRMDMFRSRILQPMHKSRLIEYDKESGKARISPLGVKEIEKYLVNHRSR
jgi:hypothetical protein